MSLPSLDSVPMLRRGFRFQFEPAQDCCAGWSVPRTCCPSGLPIIAFRSPRPLNW